MFERRRGKERVFSKKRRFDYSRKKFENPFFKKQKRVTVGMNLKLKILGFLFLALGGSLLWFFLFSEFWQIDEIKISGLKRMDKGVIEALVRQKMDDRSLWIIPHSNYFLFSQDELAAELVKRYHFENISIRKKPAKTLEIKLEERPLACVWREGESYYYCDDDGNIMESISLDKADREKYPIIHNESSNKIKNSLAQVDNEYIKFILRLFEVAKDSPIGFEIDHFLIDDEKETVKVIPGSGPIIKFSTRNGAEEQIDKLIIIRHEKLKDDFEGKKYIDLRFGDKIYFQ